MGDELGKQILKEVSRSFYLTLRILPAEMRDAASLGYLLARTSDTIADTEGVPAEVRERLLMDYADSVSRGDHLPQWPAAMLAGASAGERKLLEHGEAVLQWLSRTDEPQAGLIREVVATIIGGQLLDLKRFGYATKEGPVALRDDGELADYTWCVAGCVGAFWTKLGFLTLGPRYSDMSPAELLERGIAYGKGLQLVNILRDLPRDLEAGRCYLPVVDPSDRNEVMHAFHHWHQRACGWIGEGISYAATLKSRRLRTATVLPALIAEETLEKLKGVSWQSLQCRVKVPRHDVYRLLAEAVLF